MARASTAHAVTLPASAAVLGLVGLAAIPGVLGFLAQTRENKPRDNFYEDQDGKSTPEAVAAFSNSRPKAAIVTLAAAGFATFAAAAILTAVDSDVSALALPAWLVFGAWAGILLQAILVAAHHAPVQTLNLGLFAFGSCIVTIAISIFQAIQVSAAGATPKDPVLILRSVNIVIAILLAFACILIPRRPDVFFRDGVVDRAYTVSVLSRQTWSWPWPLLQLAAKKGDLVEKDLPQPDHFLRVDKLVARWHSFGFKKSLGWSLVWAYKRQIAGQWSVTILSCIVGAGPFYVMLSLLNILEREPKDGWPSLRLWGLAISLGLFSLAAQWLNGWVIFQSVSQISMPIRAQISALVFQKSLKRKVVGAANKKKEDKTDAAVAPPLVEEAILGDAVETSGEISDAAAAEAGQAAGAAAKDDDAKEVAKTAEPTDDATALKSQQAVVNLVGVDSRRVSSFFSLQFFIVDSVGKLAVYSIFLVNLIGWIPFAAGILAWALVLPINAYFSKMYMGLSKKLMEARDQKLAVVNEALLGMRQIKFAALENQWETRIQEKRNTELLVLWKIMLANIVLMACWIASPIFLAVASLSTYATVNGELTPSIAFVSIGIFSALELTLGAIPELVTMAMDTVVSLRRIDTYLKGPEMKNIVLEGSKVAFENASVAWPVDDETPDEERFILNNLNLTFPSGKLSVISGKTGTGKSLMLSAILGEVDLLEGSVTRPPTAPPTERHDDNAHPGNWILPGAVAYVGQTPWLESASFRDNVLFGLPFIEERYNQVLHVCALEKDLEVLVDGDKTELGANGINLSGGQKWRITLARAIYSRAEILVMDDIFSAVDANVGRHIFDKCIAGEICAGRTRILVTHHVSLVQSEAKFVVELGEGTVLHSGLIADLAKDGTLQKIKEDGEGVAPEGDVAAVAVDGATAVNSKQASDAGEDENGAPLQKAASKDAKKFIEEESREKGMVKKDIYSTYLRDSGGWPFWIFCMILFVSFQAGNIGQAWWLRIWTGQSGEVVSVNAHRESGYPYAFSQLQSPVHAPASPYISTGTGVDGRSLKFYLSVYVGLAMATAFIGTMRFLWTYTMSIRASRILFRKILGAVIRTPLRWLDTVPVGRILNRLTADFDVIDTQISTNLGMMLSQILSLLGVAVAGALVSGLVLPVALVLIMVASWVGMKFLDGARPLKRLESTSKSPVFELFNAALAGMTTLRAYQKAHVYIDRMNTKLDLWNTITVYMTVLNRWMGFRMTLLGTFFSTGIAIIVIVSPQIDAAMAGFTLSFAIEFAWSMIFAIRTYSSLELAMNATERVIEYSQLKTEDLGGEKPPAAWPVSGRMEVEDLVVGYAEDLPPVLKGISFSVKDNERIGVVGRTGAGKSSLTLALFRFLEPRSGKVIIDGLDTSKMELHSLRSRLAIIPQDPVLFSGTIRSNLDPFNERTDAELRDSLARVHLVDSEPATPANEPSAPNSGAASAAASTAVPRNANVFRDLSHGISESGGNLSQGQRQLLCLARAIVARPRIMVLDEATSAVDMTTDALIQRSIREEFGESTLLVIAHRLSTVADFDRILVLSDGKVAEFGTPKELWETEGGVFRDMCEKSGETAKLRETILGGA